MNVNPFDKLINVFLEKIDDILDFSDLKPIREIIINNDELNEIKNQKQTRFHFIPDFLIKKHKDDNNFFSLNLINKEIKRVNNNNDFVNVIESDSWYNEYFLIIEYLIKKSKYEEIVSSFLNISEQNKSKTFLYNEKNFYEALFFLTFRVRQFSFDENEIMLNQIKDNNFRIERNKKNWSCIIEYILRSLIWFGQIEILNNFILNLKNKLLNNLTKDDLEFEFVLHQSWDENWKTQYKKDKDNLFNFIKNNENICVNSWPNNLDFKFPLLSEPISHWKISIIPFIPHRQIDFYLYYIQFNYSNFSIFFKNEEDLKIFDLAANKFKKENNIKINSFEATIGSFLRQQLYYEDDGLVFLYGDYDSLNIFKDSTRNKKHGIILIKKNNENKKDKIPEFWNKSNIF